MHGGTGKPANANSHYETLLYNTENANKLMRVLANETRLKILCILGRDEKSVSEIKALVSQPQPMISQQLAVLRAEGLVESRRDGKTIYYNLKHPSTRGILDCLEGIVEFGIEL